jgi:hypothetical protein
LITETVHTTFWISKTTAKMLPFVDNRFELHFLVFKNYD